MLGPSLPAAERSPAATLVRTGPAARFRLPTTPVFSTIQPVIFVLLFRYVFGGASGPSPASATSTS